MFIRRYILWVEWEDSAMFVPYIWEARKGDSFVVVVVVILNCP